MKNLQTALQSITVENGYTQSILAVERFLQKGQSQTVTPTIIILDGEDNVSEEETLSNTGNLIIRTLNIGLNVIDRQDADADALSASEHMNSLIADIQKAMQLDYQRGGHALDTNEVSVSPIEAEEGQPDLSLTMVYAIKYRHRRNDPTLET